jgi:hypothetical protein
LRHDLPVGEALLQGRQQFAPGKVAGTAENDQIECIQGQRLRSHGNVLFGLGRYNEDTTKIPLIDASSKRMAGRAHNDIKSCRRKWLANGRYQLPIPARGA